MGRWNRQIGKAWTLTPKRNQGVSYWEYPLPELFGYETITYLPAESRPFPLNQISIVFSDPRQNHPTNTSYFLGAENYIFPVIILSLSDILDQNHRDEIMPKNSGLMSETEQHNWSLVTRHLKTDADIKKALNYIKKIETTWDIDDTLFKELSVFNRPPSKEFLKLCEPKTEDEDSWGDTTSYYEDTYEKQARLDKAMTALENLANYYYEDKDSFKQFIQKIEKQVEPFPKLFNRLCNVRSKVLGETITLKRTYHDVQVEDKSTQTPSFISYQTGSSSRSNPAEMADLQRRVAQLEETLKTLNPNSSSLKN